MTKTFTSDEYSVIGSDKRPIKSASTEGKTFALTPNKDNPFAQQDYALVIRTFEIDSANWAEEDYALAPHYKDVYSTRNFSTNVREQMNYYPGMHQSPSSSVETTASTPNPAVTQAQKMKEERMQHWNSAMSSPDAFMNGLRSRQEDFDYSQIFGSDASAKTRAEHIGKMITQCVPCFDRLLDPGNLLPDGDLLEVHLMNINIRTDLIDKLKELFKDPGLYLDICELLNLLSHLCPQDLLAMLALLTQYLAKLNLEIKFNLDFIMNLVGAILSPFLDALSQWLDKWIQMILGPIICVVNHVNETIAIAQSAKIPFSEASFDVGVDLGLSSSPHNNIATGISSGTKEGKTWAKGEWERFETPAQEKYNPQRPEWPTEEVQMANEEMSEAWNPTFSEEEREERNQRWRDLKTKERKKRTKVPPPLRSEPRDGTRWSRDDVPNSEKKDFLFGEEYYPPEKQEAVTGYKDKEVYWDASPLINSIVQLRNILQSAIQYIKDWFTYITQMIYDLLGVDFGWMDKKTGTTVLKSRLIQMIFIIKAIIEAISKNGLRCGTHSNLDSEQTKFILEEGLNKFSGTTFKVQPDGSIKVFPPGTTASTPSIQDLSDELTGLEEAYKESAPGGSKRTKEASTEQNEMGVDMGPGIGTVDDKAKARKLRQKSVQSGIVVKNCLKDVTTEELIKARAWISEFERSSNG